MSVSASKQLRQLCTDYFDNVISKEEYRSRRTVLFDKVFGIQTELPTQTVTPSSPVATQDALDITQRTVPITKQTPIKTVSQPSPNEPKSSSTLLKALLGGAAMLGVTAALMLSIRDPEPIPAVDFSDIESSEVETITEQAVPPEPSLKSIASSSLPETITEQAAPPKPLPEPPDFLQRFNAASDWTESTFSEFLFEWDQLTVNQQSELRGSIEFREFTANLQQQIRESRALLDRQDPQSIASYELALAFAAELGIDAGVPHVASKPIVVADVEEPSVAPDPVSPQPDEPTEPLVAAATLPEVIGQSANLPGDALASTDPTQLVSDTSSTTSGAQESSSQSDSAPAASSLKDTPDGSTTSKALAADKSTSDTSSSDISVAKSGSLLDTTPNPNPTQRRRACGPELVSAVPLPPPARRTCWDNFANGNRGPLLVVQPPGKITLGSLDKESYGPPKVAQIDRPFAISLWEISVGEFRAFCIASGRECPSLSPERNEYPVSGITWQQARDYTDWLSAELGARYRLPTEAEWEYAARAGTTTRYPFGDSIDSNQAVFESGGNTEPKPRDWRIVANPFGLKHVVGNLAEWALNDWSDQVTEATTSTKTVPSGSAMGVVRGGSFKEGTGEITSASRQPADRAQASDTIGFRVLREL